MPPSDVQAELEELKALYDSGLLSEHAWNQQTLRILNGEPVSPPAQVVAAAAVDPLLHGGDGRPPETEAAARVQLAAAYRMAARMGINEADQNHMTLMCPTKPRTFLSIGRGSLWSRVKAGELLEVSVDDDDYQPDQPDSGDSYGSKAVNGYMLDLESSA